ncbi:sulfotransferase [Vibrio sp. 10N]|uniref:sulfotransferase n=1 Tax=Vibrio sp. 10N TaxID=3058938 RepID=UPI002813BC7C|nr:hypothetical protein VB10N_29150 [Vibrio sp. 10N]
MYSYFSRKINADFFDLRLNSPSAGLSENGDLGFEGYLISQRPIRNITCTSYFDTKAKITLNIENAEPSERIQLGISEKLHLLKYKVFVSMMEDVNDLHCKLDVEVEEGQWTQLFAFCVQHHQIFPEVRLVVGSPRSGTTAVGMAVNRGEGVRSHGESHVLQGVVASNQSLEDFFIKSSTAQVTGNLVNEMPKTMTLAANIKMVREIYRRHYGDTVYVDKTPGIPMLNSLEFAFDVWPNAKVIFCKRRGIENVQSRLIKFPNVPFEHHVKQWRQTFIIWRRTQALLSSKLKRNDWFFELEQYELANKPEPTIRQLSEFLNWNNMKFSRALNAVLGKRPQQTSQSDRAKSLADMSWTEENKSIFSTVCSEEMARQGYSLDSQYYASVLNNK